VSVSLFGGTTPLVATWLVYQTGSNLAPGFYLTVISIIGFLVTAFFFTNTSGKSLKGSYPTVATKSEFKEAVENPKDALWWKEGVETSEEMIPVEEKKNNQDSDK